MISLQGVELAFGEKKVLQGVDLEVKKGETMAVIGPSGTGKSTILKVLIGLLEPTGGKVCIEGQDVSHLTEEEWNEIRKHIGMVFQYSALFDFLDVWPLVCDSISGCRKKKSGRKWMNCCRTWGCWMPKPCIRWNCPAA